MRARWMTLLATAGVVAAAQAGAATEVQFGPAVEIPVGEDFTAMALVGPGLADPNDGRPGVLSQWIALLTPSLGPPSVTVVALHGDTVIGRARHGVLPVAEGHVLATGDLDENGRNELLVASSNPNRIAVFGIPDGPAPLDDEAVVTTSGSSPGRPVVAELTGDTHPDVGVMTGAGLEVFPGDGNGGLGPSQLAVSTATLLGANTFGFVQRFIAAGDLTGDGHAEVVVAVNRPDILSLSHNDLFVLAGGTFAPIGDPVGAFDAISTMELADVDGDGNLDRVLAGQSLGVAHLTLRSYTPYGGVEFGDGLGGFGGGIRFIDGPGGDVYLNPPDPIGTTIADLDLDGRPDLLSAPGRPAGPPPTLETRSVLPSRELSGAPPVSIPVATAQTLVADVTGDGVPDIVTPGSQPKTLAVVPALTGVKGRPLEFGDLQVGTAGQALQVPITRVGAGTATVTTVRLAGEAAGDFRLTGDACTGVTLPAGDGCSVALTFRPTAAGRRAAQVDVGLTDGRTFSVPVSGTGVSPPGPPPTAPEAGATAKPPTVRARCAIRRVRGRATVICRTTFAAKPGLRVAIRLVRGGKVYAKADIRRAGRVTLHVVRPLPRGRFTVVTTARLSKAKQTRQPLTV